MNPQNELNYVESIYEENNSSEIMNCASYEETGKKCPACGSTETQNRGPFWYCTRCDYEW